MIRADAMPPTATPNPNTRLIVLALWPVRVVVKNVAWVRLDRLREVL